MCEAAFQGASSHWACLTQAFQFTHNQNLNLRPMPAACCLAVLETCAYPLAPPEVLNWDCRDNQIQLLLTTRAGCKSTCAPGTTFRPLDTLPGTYDDATQNAVAAFLAALPRPIRGPFWLCRSWTINLFGRSFPFGGQVLIGACREFVGLSDGGT
jgi:hypothetical protein